MAKVLGLRHTDGRVIVVDWKIGDTHIKNKQNEMQNMGEIRAYEFASTAQYLRFKSGSQTRFERPAVPSYDLNIPDVVSKMNKTPDGTVTDGVRLNHLVHDFVLEIANEKDPGWELVYES